MTALVNKHRGEVGFSCSDENLVLKFTANSLVALEDAMAAGIAELGIALADPMNVRVKTIRALFWAGLLHAKPQITAVEAGELMDEIGLTRAQELVLRAINLAFAVEGGDGANPPQPGRDGIGQAS